MTRVISIHQPNYLPYLGFFDKMKRSDIFVIFDDAQFTERDFHNRNRIKTAQGVKWLTIPVKKSRIPLNQIKIKDESVGTGFHWCDYHYELIASAYGKSSFFKKFSGEVKELYEKAKALQESNSLAGNNILFISFLMKKFGITTPIMLSSDMNIHTKRNERIIDICKNLNANFYLSGEGGKNYLEEKLFNESGIGIIYQNFKHPIYPQRMGDFIPLMSALDYLFNCGTDFPR